MLPEGLCLGETRRFVQMKCLVHQLCQWRKWLGFEMKSLMYFSHRGPFAILQSGGASVALKVQFYQYLLKDVGVGESLLISVLFFFILVSFYIKT